MNLKSAVKETSVDNEDQEQLTLKDELATAPDSEEEEPLEEEDYRIEETGALTNRFFSSSHCSVCVYMALLLIIIGSFVALVVIVLQVVLPFSSVQGFVNGTCSVTSVQEDSKTCMCGAACKSNFRCIAIRVTYRNANGESWNATMFENESVLGREVM